MKSVSNTKTTHTNAINKATRMMTLLNFPTDTIENFKKNGKPGYCMEDGKPQPLSADDKWFINLFDKADFTIYAAIRYHEKSLEFSTAYLFVDRSESSRTMWYTALKMSMPMAFIARSAAFGFELENQPVKISRLPNGMFERLPASPEEMDMVLIERYLSI